MLVLRPFLVVAALLAASAAGGCAPERAAEGGAPAAEAAYVGDEACGSCHGDLYASYHETGMGRSVTRFDPATAPERFDATGRGPVVCHEPSGYCYQAFVRGDTLFQRETRPDTPGYERVHAASHVVGSGNATRSYMMTTGAATPGGEGEVGFGYLTEMPLTWYVERSLWDLSPGYVQQNSRFERPITLECMTCHNGRPGFADGTQNAYTNVPLGITCERCHGPGGAHVEARLADAGGGGADPTIVNPARLDATRQLAVCQQCHLTGFTVFAEGEDPTTYRPGTPLTDHRRVFVREEQVDDPERFGISSHALRLMRSACFEETQGTDRALTCTTCHDPHRPTARMDPDHFNAACRSCHGGDGSVGGGHEVLCSRPEAGIPQEAVTGDCVSCHLQRAGTDDIPHVTFTDHWIRRRLPPARPPEAIERGGTVTEPFVLVDATAREQALARAPGRARAASDTDLGLAYWMLYETQHPLPDYLPRVVSLLRAGEAAGVYRPDASLALGGALRESGALAEAAEVFAEGAERWPGHARLLYALGDVRLRLGDAAGAADALTQAVAAQPGLVEARLEQAAALAAAGRAEDALAAYREGLRRAPDLHADGWNNYGFLLLQGGRAAEAAEALRRAVGLRPPFVEARANLGAALLAQGDLESAEAQFEAALRYDPVYVPALGNLAVISAERGETAEARRLLEQVLALSPGDAQAAAYLQQLNTP